MEVCTGRRKNEELLEESLTQHKEQLTMAIVIVCEMRDRRPFCFRGSSEPDSLVAMCTSSLVET